MYDHATLKFIVSISMAVCVIQHSPSLMFSGSAQLDILINYRYLLITDQFYLLVSDSFNKIPLNKYGYQVKCSVDFSMTI